MSLSVKFKIRSRNFFFFRPDDHPLSRIFPIFFFPVSHGKKYFLSHFMGGQSEAGFRASQCVLDCDPGQSLIGIHSRHSPVSGILWGVRNLKERLHLRAIGSTQILFDLS
jgi:hypothetical protein